MVNFEWTFCRHKRRDFVAYCRALRTCSGEQPKIRDSMYRLTARLLGLLILLFSVLSHVDAQMVIRGQVIDGETGDPVFAAGVLVEGTTTGTSTDFDGRFR